MKNSMSIRTMLLSITIAVLSVTSVAQNRERFGISAKAGGVNAVLGRVMISRKDQQPQLLASTDSLVAGDVVTTGSMANVEVLLNPGSYLRLGENSEFELKNTDLDNLQLKLTKGTAIVEVTGVDNLNFQIPVETPLATFTILRSGLYRVTVQPDSAELAVQKGRASFGNTREALVKSGKKVTFTNGVATVAKLGKDKDSFDVWSKQRAELLARANERLSGRQLNGYLATFRDTGLWGAPRFGLWTFSSRMGCYTFLPFFYGWSSPYGHYYGSYFDIYYWRGGGWGNGNLSPGTSGTIVNNTRPPSGSNGNGSPGGSPAPSYVPPVSQTPMRVDRDTGERMNKPREP